MDTSDLPFAKPRPAKLERTDKRKRRAASDEAENKKVRARSGGRCELIELHPNEWNPKYSFTAKRCVRPALHIHHKIGGWGKRARGASILAENKLHLCERCHSDIHAHVLVPDGLAAKDFRRIK